MTPRPRTHTLAGVVFVLLAASTGVSSRQATDRLKNFPGFDNFERMQLAFREPVFVSGALNVVWAEDSRSVLFTQDGRRRQFHVATRVVQDVPHLAMQARVLPRPSGEITTLGCPASAPDRGRQRTCEVSPDGLRKAFYRDRNVFVADADGAREIAVTTDGSPASRVKYGSASWAYGEELDQRTAIWWSPNGRYVAFYRFDESGVPDYYVTKNQTAVQVSLDVEAYPAAGTRNPVPDVLVCDLQSMRVTALDVRDGQPFGDDVVGHYVYAIEWSPDSSEVRLLRTDRQQRTLEYAACHPSSADCRAIVRESWPTGWVDAHPVRLAVGDGERFVWASHRTGWRNYYLYDRRGRLVNAITSLASAHAEAVVRVDAGAGLLYYLARDGDSPAKLQLHRVGLDGRGDQRLTDPAFTHQVTLSPDGSHFIDVYQTHDSPPATRVVGADGSVVAELASSSLARFDELGLRKIETFTYVAADEQTPLVGSIALPTRFDPARRYPVIVAVYGGPESPLLLPNETFAPPPPAAELGFLIVTLSTRAAPWFSRPTLDALHGNLGIADVDDLARGVEALGTLPYVDRTRIGIYGTSYGGYTATMALLRYPTLFAAAVASSPVTDWRSFDTIYTERYMSTPARNPAGYVRASAMTYAPHLQGRLLIYFGTADTNVHPSHSLQLIQALTQSGKSVDVQVGSDLGHGSIATARMLEFFVEHLIVRPPDPLPMRP